MSVHQENIILQNKACNAVIDEVMTTEFCSKLDPELVSKLRLAAKYVFQKGVDFGAVRVADVLIDEIRRGKI